MKTKAKLLMETLTDDSGRNVFSTKEAYQLVEISYLEGIGNVDNLNEKIKEFKCQFVLKESDWKEQRRIKMEKVIQKKYFSIGNGGIEFTIIDSNVGPEVDISFDSFGHTSELKTFFSSDDLKKIGEMFIEASNYKFTEETYCHAAKFYDLHGKPTEEQECSENE